MHDSHHDDDSDSDSDDSDNDSDSDSDDNNDDDDDDLSASLPVAGDVAVHHGNCNALGIEPESTRISDTSTTISTLSTNAMLILLTALSLPASALLDSAKICPCSLENPLTLCPERGL